MTDEAGFRVRETADAAALLRWAAPVLAAHPFTTNMLATVAAGRAARSADGSTPDALWWVAQDGDGGVVGAAGRTRSGQLLLSPMPDAAAAALAIAVDSPNRHRLHGPAATVAAYAAAVPGVRVETVRNEIVRVLGALRPPGVPGSVRPETDADLPLLIDWMQAAADEMGTAGPGDGRAEAAAAVHQRRARAGFRWWVLDGQPRAVAGWARTAAIARIGPVYTPPPERRRGFASAVTAALAAELSADGAAVMLHADEANATSNHIYADLGFAAVDRLLLADLVAEVG